MPRGSSGSGFRILPDDEPLFDFWAESRPAWTADYLLLDRPARDPARYLLTFRPFGRLPAAIQKAYLAGKLHLLPFPGSLTYWGVPGYRHLHRELLAASNSVTSRDLPAPAAPEGLVPQSGFLHEPTARRPDAGYHAGHVRNTYKRTHRWDKILRDQDELALISREDKLLHVLFSTLPNDLSLYDKPMARNVQLWTEDHRLLLDGPNATPEQLHAAMRTVEAGGLFGYRFLFPAMRVGRHEVYWHRSTGRLSRNASGEPVVIPDALPGYLTAYEADTSKLDRPVELWPRFRQRPVALAALALHKPGSGHPGPGRFSAGVRKLLDASARCGGRPLPRSVARALLAVGHRQTLESWLDALPESVAPGTRELIESEEPALPRRGRTRAPDALTYRRTATRSFEVRYWKTIAALGEGPFLNKNNADCCRDPITQKLLPYHERHLEPLRLPTCSRTTLRTIAAARMTWQSSGRGAVPVAHGPRLLVDGRVAEEPGGGRGRAEHRRRDSGSGPHASGHHVRPLRHGVHGRPVRAELRGRRGADRGVRGRRQPFGDGRDDAGRADLSRTESEGATGARHLADSPDR